MRCSNCSKSSGCLCSRIFNPPAGYYPSIPIQEDIQYKMIEKILECVERIERRLSLEEKRLNQNLKRRRDFGEQSGLDDE